MKGTALKLTPKENQLRDAVYKGEFREVTGRRRQNLEKVIRQAARNTVEKKGIERTPISIKIPMGELEAFKKNAAREGLKYQTKLNQLIYFYNRGKIKM